MSKKNYAEIALSYCYDVINDQLSNRKTCQLEKLACQRHLNDLARQDDPDYPFYFSETAANRRCRFTEMLPHTKGKWRGQLIVLEPHQIFIEAVMFGWLKKSNDKRRFTKAYVKIPRKNGKSAESATTGLYMAFADGEKTAEVYCGATTEKQAMMVFEPAWQMVKLNEDFASYYGITLSGTPKNPTAAYNIEDMSRIEPVVGKPGDGASPHCAIVDEYHEHPTSVLFDAMDTGMGARDQPLLLVITTAGDDTSSPCYELELEAIKVLEGSLQNDRLFVMIFGVDKGDSYEDFEVWKKSNPNFGISINEDYLRGKYNDAMSNVAQRNILLTKHLNIWMNAGVSWADMQRFELCKRPELKIADFEGNEVWIGVDLASKIDIAAVIFMFKINEAKYNVCPKCGSSIIFAEGKYVCIKSESGCSWSRRTSLRTACFGKFYLPEETVNKKENQHYQTWRDQGYLTVTEGARTDFQKIEDDIEAISKLFIVKEMTYDPKEASYLVQNIQKWANFEVVEFPQGPALISEPMKEMEAMIMDGDFLHDGNPVFTWMMGNVIKKKAKSGGEVKHYFPTKQTAANKIDGPVAAICALGRMVTYNDESGDSYNARAARGEENILRVL